MWKLCEDEGFKESLCSWVLCKLLAEKEWRIALSVMADFSLEELGCCKSPIEILVSSLAPSSPDANTLIAELLQVAETAPPIFAVLSPSVLRVFNQSGADEKYTISAIKLLLAIYKFHGNKEAALPGVVKMLLSVYLHT